MRFTAKQKRWCCRNLIENDAPSLYLLGRQQKGCLAAKQARGKLKQRLSNLQSFSILGFLLLRSKIGK